MKTISLKMEDKILRDIDGQLIINRYSTRTEFIRDAIRSKLLELEKYIAIKKLAKLKGSETLQDVSVNKLNKLAEKEFKKFHNQHN